MKIPVNKDFLTEYKDDAFKGFTAKELLFIAGGAAIGIAAAALLHIFSGVPLQFVAYIAIPFAFPVIASGFFRYQGYMTPWELLAEMRYSHAAGNLVWESSEDDADADHAFSTSSPEERDGGRAVRRKGKVI